MSEFELYLITRLDAINVAFTGLIFLFVISAIVMLVTTCIFYAETITSDDRENNTKDFQEWKRYVKWTKNCIIAIIVTVFVTILVPTTKDLVIMKTMPLILNNEEAQKLPNNFLGFINSWLREETKNK